MNAASAEKARNAEAMHGARLAMRWVASEPDQLCVVCGLKIAERESPVPVYWSEDGTKAVCCPCFVEFQKAADWKALRPHRRQLRAPLTTDQLTPLDSWCQLVQIGPACHAFTESDFRAAGEFLAQYPGVPLRVYGTLKDLDFLRHFPFLKGFSVDAWEIENLDGLRFLSQDLESLGLGRTKSRRYSLRLLERFPGLKRLYVEGHTKDFSAISGLTHLETLTLRSITLRDLSALVPLTRLQSLAIKLGGTADLRLLPQIGRLRYLEVWMVRGLSDLGAIGDLKHLQFLFLQALKHVKTLPSFAKLRSLRRVRLLTMKGLRDLTPISEAPALEELATLDMPQLKPESFRPFLGHPRLRGVLLGLGSRKKDEAVHSLLGLPKYAGQFVFVEEKRDRELSES